MGTKKVGIITSYLDFDKNYGGVLQAYALSKQIEKLGYDAYIMPYVYEHIPTDKKAKKWFWRLARTVRNFIDPQRSVIFCKKKVARTMMGFVNRKLPVYCQDRMRLRDLSNVANAFDAFVCGSDQVWSTKLQKDHCDPGMFLKFVPQSVKKIAYAPSLGSTTSVTAETAQEIRENLSDFTAISLRENAGRALIKDVTGKEYPIVLDPTLLMKPEEWDDIADVPKNIPEKYILVYRFGNIPHTYKKIKEIQNKLGLPIIELPSSKVSYEDDFYKRYDVDPGKFIGLIQNAALVCTDSFHATVFCILSKTPFITFFRQEPTSEYNMNGRVTDLLKIAELEDRLVVPGAEINYDGMFNVDFGPAHKNISRLRTPSLEFLRNALKGETE